MFLKKNSFQSLQRKIIVPVLLLGLLACMFELYLMDDFNFSPHVILSLVTALILCAITYDVIRKHILLPTRAISAAIRLGIEKNLLPQFKFMPDDEIGELAQVLNETLEALKKSQEQVQLALKGSSDGIWDLYNMETGESWWSPQLYKLLGYEDGEIEASVRSFRKMLHPDDHDKLDAALGQHTESENPFDIEFRLRIKSGEYRWFNSRGQANFDENHKPIRMAGFITDIHARKLAEDAIRSSEIIKSAILESSLDSIISMDSNGVVVEFNKAAEKTFGYALSEVAGQPLAELIIPEQYRDRHRKGLARFLESGESKVLGKRIEILALRKDGTEFPAELAISMIKLDEKPYFTATIRDITERKNAEEMLRTTQERYDLAIKGSYDGIWDWNIVTNAYYCSPRFKQLLGYQDDEFTNSIDAFTSHLHPDDLVTVTKALRKHSREKAVYDIEHRLRTKSGEYRWFRTRGEATRDESGKATRMAGSFTDIHEARLAEIKLSMSEQRYDLAVRGSSAGVWDWNALTGELYWSDRLKELFGVENWTDSQITVDAYTNLIHPDDRQKVWEKFQNHVANKVSYLVEHRLLVKTEYRWFLCTGQALWNEEGHAIRVAGSCTDIHENKLAEQALLEAKIAAEEAHKQLEAVNQELKASIERANAMALEADTANRFKSLFLANMSHEIRTPLNGIAGMTGLLLDQNLTKEQQEYADTILICSETLLSLINDILDLSKIEAEKFELESRNFVIKETVENTLNMLAMKAYEKGLVYGCQIDSSIPRVINGDEARLRQILINLIGNAIKFTDFGEVSVKVKFESETETKLKLRFSVCDTGIGISEEKISKLFQTFSQVDPSHTRKYGGTGLGLAISKKLAELMNGTIGVNSVVNEGTEFWFTVEFEKALVENEKSSAEYLKPAQKTNLPMLKILVVEDNIINQKVAIGILRKYGLSGETAQNGVEALKMLSKTNYDLVLMDIQMPELDGLETTKKIRRQEQSTHKHLPIIAMTAQAIKGDKEKCLEAGMDDYITKPVNPEALFQAIQKCVLKQNSALSFYKATLNLDKDLFDGSQLMERVGKNEEVFYELVELFLEDTGERINTMRDAIVQRDILTLLKVAHAVKGSSANMGSKILNELCMELESACHENLPLRAESLASELEHEYDKLKQILTSQMLNSKTQPVYFTGYQ